MPQLLAVAIAYAIPATGAVVVGTITVAEIIATVIVVAGTMAYSAAQKRKAEQQGKEAFNASQVDRMANIVTTTGARELVLGRVRKGGVVGFRGSAGPLQDKFLLHLSVADHEVDGFEEYYLNDKKVTLDAQGRVLDRPYYQTKRASREAVGTAFTGAINGSNVYVPGPSVVVPLVYSANAALVPNVSVTVVFPGDPTGNSEGGTPDFVLAAVVTPGGDYGVGAYVTIADPGFPTTGVPVVRYSYAEAYYYAKIWSQVGTDTEVADARSRVLFPTLITTEHRGRGVAKIIAEFTYNETAFPTGMVQLTAQLRGAKVFDPRTGVTAFTENPALHMRHVYVHPWFGKATVTADEEERFKAAANACDTLQDYAVGASVENRKLYRSALVVQYGANASMVLDDLAQAMAGMWDYAGGEIYLRAGVWTNPVITLTDDDVASTQRIGDSESSDQLSIAPHRPRVDKFNVLNIQIWNQENDYKQMALAPVKGTDLITRDGEELAQPFVFPAVFYHRQAQHVGGVLMRDARDPLTIEIPFKMRAFPIELFDTIRFISARYGWLTPGKTFIVRRRVWFPDRGVVKLSMKETAAPIFTVGANFLAQGYADNTALPTPWDILPPVFNAGDVFSGSAELVFNSDGTILSAVRVRWNAINDARVTEGGFVDVSWSYATSTSGKWRTVTGDAADGEVTIVGVQDKRAILIRMRTRNAIAVSDWSPEVLHTVVGKTAAPKRVGVVTATAAGRQLLLDWPDNPEVDVALYGVKTVDAAWGKPSAGGFVYVGRATSKLVEPPAAGVSVTYYVRARDTSGNWSTLSRSVTVVGAVPGNVGALTKTVVRGKMSLNFADVAPTALPLGGYEVRPTDAGWGTTGYLWRGPSSRTPFLKMASGLNTWYVRAYDVDGRYSAASASISHTFDIPATLTAIDATKRARERVIIAVSGPSIPSDLKHFEFQILLGGAGDVWVPTGVGLTDVIRSQIPSIRWKPTAFGTFRVSVRMVDVDNNVSAASISTSFTISRIVA